MTRILATYVAIWLAIATAVAAGVLIGGLLLATTVSASREAERADLPTPSGRMTTEPSLPSPDSTRLRERPEPVALRASVPGAEARTPSPSASPSTPVRATSRPLGLGSAASEAATISAAVAYAKARLSDREWACFDALVERESRWNPLARNRKSGAWGLMQTHPAERLDSWGDRQDPMVQVRWGLGYLHGRYGGDGTAGACNALDHAILEGWY